MELHDLPEGATIQQTPSVTPEEVAAGAENDDCHHEVDGVGNSALKKALMGKHWTQHMICDPAGVRPLTQADVDGFATGAEPAE